MEAEPVTAGPIDDELRDAVASIVTDERVAQAALALCRARTPNGEEEDRARVVQALLSEAGVPVELEWVLPRRPNVIARVPGSGDGPSLMLNGHIDASYHHRWTRDPHDPWVECGHVYGGGVTDMLGAVASMIVATQAVKALGPPPGDLVFLASMYHDTVGLGVKYALASASRVPEYGICGEPSSLAIHTANGGAVKFEIVIEGRAAHVSRLRDGADALAAAVDVCAALRHMEPTCEPDPRLPDLPIVHVGQMNGGIAPGAVADRAVIRGDVRTLPSMTAQTVRADLERVIGHTCGPELETRLDLIAVQRPYLGNPGSPLVHVLERAHRAVTGSGVTVTTRMPVQAFVTDTADMQAFGVESLIYGPCDWQYVPEENASVEELTTAARVYALVSLALRYGT